jgi:hypothetical protein
LLLLFALFTGRSLRFLVRFVAGAVEDQAAIACRINFARFVKRLVGNWVIGVVASHFDHEALSVRTAAESITSLIFVSFLANSLIFCTRSLSATCLQYDVVAALCFLLVK